MPFVRINEINVHYQQQGVGRDVVLIHAFTSNLAVWMLTDIVPTLAKRFRVTCYDLRGHGASEATPHGYTSNQLSSDLLGLKRELQLGPALLVGHSYGGVVGFHAAHKEPEWVRGLVLSDTFFPGLSRLEPNMRTAGAWRDLQDTFQKAGLELPPEVDFSTLFQIIAALEEPQITELRKTFPPSAMRWLTATRKLAGTHAGEEMFETAGLDEAAIQSIQTPVAAIYDEHTPFAATQAFLVNHLSNCVVDVVPDANHLGPVQNPQAFVEIVSRHLNRMDESVPL